MSAAKKVYTWTMAVSLPKVWLWAEANPCDSFWGFGSEALALGRWGLVLGSGPVLEVMGIARTRLPCLLEAAKLSV